MSNIQQFQHPMSTGGGGPPPSMSIGLFSSGGRASSTAALSRGSIQKQQVGAAQAGVPCWACTKKGHRFTVPLCFGRYGKLTPLQNAPSPARPTLQAAHGTSSPATTPRPNHPNRLRFGDHNTNLEIIQVVIVRSRECICHINAYPTNG